tara:strand:- start:2747 stop:3013 length:267 start_codon:yes stop_codon:yes gene_type:complete
METEKVYTHTRIEDDEGNTVSVRGPWSYTPSEAVGDDLDTRFEAGMTEIDDRFNTIGEMGYGELFANTRKLITQGFRDVYELLRRKQA